jgi:hypothetical protein
MGVERYVVETVVRDGRSHREVARSAGVSKTWVTKLLARYREGGDAALRSFSTSGDRHASVCRPHGALDSAILNDLGGLCGSLADRRRVSAFGRYWMR